MLDPLYSLHWFLRWLFARPRALFAHASYAVVLADARPAALLAFASSVVVLTDARPAALLAPVSFAVVFTDARSTTQDRTILTKTDTVEGLG